MADLSKGDAVVFLADGFAVPLRGRVVELDEDTVGVELIEAALDEEGILREPGTKFRVARFVVTRIG